jgi:hypothetical protein
MTTLRVPNYGRKGMGGCQGVDMGDGTKYDVDGRGRIEVDERHARQMLQSENGRMGAISELVHGFGDVSPGERRCGCGFNAFRWQRVCPRCAAELPAVVE